MPSGGSSVVAALTGIPGDGKVVCIESRGNIASKLVKIFQG